MGTQREGWVMVYHRTLAVGVAAAVIAASAGLLFSGFLTSHAVQNPTMSFDMVTTGNTYDETTNTMTVGTVDNCLTTAPPGTATQHIHSVHLVIQNVEDLVGWQARMNYLGDQMRPNTVGFAMFTDNNTGQNISFLNLPIDQVSFVHRDLSTASSIPPGAPGPQSAIVGAVYIGSQDFAISPDTPAKAVPDDTSYSTSGGGVLASVTLQVRPGMQGNPSLFMNMDDDSPNAPGSNLQIFTSTGLITLPPPVSQLGDGYHGEGATCVPLNCTTLECPGPSPDPTPPASCPSPSPTPPAPSTSHSFCNDRGFAVRGISVQYDRSVTASLSGNAPGCPSPTVTGPDVRGYWHFDWGVTCIDPAEFVFIDNSPPAMLRCWNWIDANGTPIGPFPVCDPTPSPSPSPSPTPTATATATPCPGCTPTPTRTPSPTATPCTGCTPTATPTATPTPLATPTPTPGLAGHDARLTRISGVPKNVRLSPGEVITDNANVVVANDGNHTETIGVYVDVTAPSGCTPSGRVLQTTVALVAGDKTTIPVPVSYSCSDVSAANGQSYTWTAVADHGANDLASCGPGSLQGLTCFNALANDDEDPADNRKSRTGPKVIAQ